MRRDDQPRERGAQLLLGPAEFRPRRLARRLVTRPVAVTASRAPCIDEAANEVVLLIHWTGGRHSAIRVPKVKTYWRPGTAATSAVEAIRKLAVRWPDREIAVTLNRMRCKTSDGETWATARVREMRERLGIPERHGTQDDCTVSLARAAERLGICLGSAKRLVERGILPAIQLMPGSTWLVPSAALESSTVKQGAQGVIDRRPKYYEDYQYDKVARLPGL